MLNIDNINSGDKYKEYKFPTIDFKFQNTGDATAFLWKFIIEIEQADLDLTPVFEFKGTVKKKQLEIDISNYGWGDAIATSIRLEEPTLKAIFEDSELHFQGLVKSGGTQTIFCLSKNIVAPQRFEEIEKTFRVLDCNWLMRRADFESEEYDYWTRLKRYESDKDKVIQAIFLDQPRVMWRSKDKNGHLYEGDGYVRASGPYGGCFALSSDGFMEFDSPAPYAGQDSDITYITIIDPTKGAHVREYPVSRSISPAGVERFHIMIGSEMSCHLSLKFKFYIDKSQVVESEAFNIHIWNPRNSRWHRNYVDGSEVQRPPNNSPRNPTFSYSQINNKIESYPFWEPLHGEQYLPSVRAKSENRIAEEPSPCPYCGELLRTSKAKQCRHCKRDWHDPNNVTFFAK